MKYQTYPAYKDSGVEWLGEVPEHWEIKRLGQFFEERREKVSDKNYAALSVTMKGIVPQLENAAKSDDGDNRKLVLKDDFVINSRSDRKGSSGVSPYDGSVSLISIVLKPKKIKPSFVHHLFRSYPFQEEFYRYGKGIVADLWSTNSSEMKNILIPEMPETEQQKIAQFLDHETAKIDTLIEKQQRLIELLKEKRQAVISHAVTKGLNPNAPMKDSGMEWLGDVPEGWQVKPIKYICNLIDGDRSSVYPNENDLVDDGIPFVSSKNIVNYKLTKKNLNYITREKFERLSRGKLIAGDLVITVRGTIGHVGIFDPEIIGCETGFINAQMMILRPINGLTDYLQLISESSLWQSQLDVAAYGSTVKQLSNEVLGSICIAIPPFDELSNFVNCVKRCCEKIERLIFHANSAIELMQERRTALISAAVTGKIDVREWDAPNA